MSAHVRRINRQDRIATGVLVGIAAFVMLMLAAIVIYILVAGAPKLFDLNFLTGKPQQFKEGGGIGPELFNSTTLYLLRSNIVLLLIGLLFSSSLFDRLGRLTERQFPRLWWLASSAGHLALLVVATSFLLWNVR